MPIPPKVQTVIDEIQISLEMGRLHIRSLGDKKSPAQVACLHLAQWTFKHCNAAITICEEESFINPAFTLLRPGLECQERAIYLARLKQPEKDKQAEEFLIMRELVKAVRCERLLNDAAEMARWKAFAPPDFPLEENCKGIVAHVKNRFPPTPSLAKHLRNLEKFWGYREIREKSMALPVDADDLTQMEDVDPIWEDACLSVHGGVGAYLVQPKPSDIYGMALKLSIGSAFALAMVNDFGFKQIHSVMQALKAYHADDPASRGSLQP